MLCKKFVWTLHGCRCSWMSLEVHLRFLPISCSASEQSRSFHSFSQKFTSAMGLSFSFIWFFCLLLLYLEAVWNLISMFGFPPKPERDQHTHKAACVLKVQGERMFSAAAIETHYNLGVFGLQWLSLSAVVNPFLPLWLLLSFSPEKTSISFCEIVVFSSFTSMCC